MHKTAAHSKHLSADSAGQLLFYIKFDFENSVGGNQKSLTMY
jgi:hypothetical protein